MSLQAGWDKTEKVNGVTFISGHDENVDATDSAIPWLFDDWFHGDFRTTRPDALSDATRDKNPSLDEYSSRTFPAYRMNSVLEIGFNTPDGQTIPDNEWEIVTEESKQSDITLEAYPNSGKGNPFRNELDHYDDHTSGQFIEAKIKGPHVARKKYDGLVSGVDGVRGSIIYGGSDKYLDTAKKQADLAALINGVSLAQPAFLAPYLAHITTFYTFIDFVFMADGTKLVRMWDASRYPAHALYMGGTKRDQNVFREGIEWNTDTYLGHDAFLKFGIEGNTPGLTPFDQLGSFGYRNGWNKGSGDHPVGFAREGGDILTAADVENALPEPLFPSNIDNPFPI